MNLSDHSEMEARLLAALQKTKSDYDSTKLQFELAMLTNDPQEIDEAARVHQRAMKKYRGALLEFNHFILDGKLILENTIAGADRKPPSRESKQEPDSKTLRAGE